MFSLLALTFESEKRFRSEGQTGVKAQKLVLVHTFTLAGGLASACCKNDCKKDTKYKNLREPLDAEPLGAFSSGFAFVTGLRNKETRCRQSDSVCSNLKQKRLLAVARVCYRSFFSVQHIFSCEEPQAVLQRHFTRALLWRIRQHPVRKIHLSISECHDLQMKFQKEFNVLLIVCCFLRA